MRSGGDDDEDDDDEDERRPTRDRGSQAQDSSSDEDGLLWSIISPRVSVCRPTAPARPLPQTARAAGPLWVCDSGGAWTKRRAVLTAHAHLLWFEEQGNERGRIALAGCHAR